MAAAELARRVASGQDVRVPLAWSPAERSALFDRVAWSESRTPQVRSLVWRLPRGRLETAQAILAHVQALPVVQSPVGAGWQVLRSTRRTLVDGGDCGPRTVLAMAMARAAGIRCETRWLTGKLWDHVWPVFIFEGHAYPGETLLEGARLGEDPMDAQDRLTH